MRLKVPGKFPDAVIDFGRLLYFVNNDYGIVRISKVRFKEPECIMKGMFRTFCAGYP